MLKPSINKKAALARADRYFQEYIRLRDNDKPCVTCGSLSASRYEAGHFISRKEMATRHHGKNCHRQCHNCNHYESGRQYEHGIAIDKMYGEGTAHELFLMSKMFCKKDKYSLDLTANEYHDKIKAFER